MPDLSEYLQAKPDNTRVASTYRYYKEKAFDWVGRVRCRESTKTQKRDNREFRMPSPESFEFDRTKRDRSQSFQSKRYRVMSRFPKKECEVCTFFSWVAYYSLLEISPQASDEEIRKSFYRLARIYHPDKNHDKQMQVGSVDKGHLQERFLKIKEAYDVLSDQVKRRQYDRNFSLFPLAVCS